MKLQHNELLSIDRYKIVVVFVVCICLLVSWFLVLQTSTALRSELEHVNCMLYFVCLNCATRLS